MEGLEASIARAAKLERTSRIDSEYFQKQFLKSAELIENWQRDSVANLTSVSDGNHFTISNDFVDDGIPYFRGQDVTGKFFAENATPIHITKEAYKRKYMVRSHLQKGDVLLSIIGTIGELSLVASDQLATCSCKLAILRPTGILAEFLAVYLRSEHGQNQIERLTRGAVQRGILLEDMGQLWVPKFSTDFQYRISQAVEDARKALLDSQARQEEAENTLLQALGLADWTPPEPLSYTARASDAFAAGRLDSEHFQGKYQAAIDQLSNAGALEFTPLTTFLSYLTNGHTPLRHNLRIGEIPFLAAEHVGDFTIDYKSEKRILKEHHNGELARTALKNGDMLMTIKGRIGNAALVDAKTPAANINQDVALLRFEEHAPPLWYLLSFLNSRFGKLEVDRWSTGQINPFLGLYNLRKINIPIFKLGFMREVGEETRKGVHSALVAKTKANDLLEAAKRAVEIAIEAGEDAAFAFLDQAERDI